MTSKISNRVADLFEIKFPNIQVGMVEASCWELVAALSSVMLVGWD
jgi:NAD(P)H-dependent flavin oxidoreductase YrpB (nitropropane dioxygenase family)